MQEQCVFCAIAAGRVPAAVVYQDERVLAFLDTRPLFPGHTLVIPREHFETLTDVPANGVGPLFERARLLAKAVEMAMEAEGTFVAINNRVSQSVPHLHIHVVPRRRKDGLKGLFWPRRKYADDAEVETVRSVIERALKSS